MPRTSLPAARLGQAVAGDLLALRLRHEVPLLLILGAPGEQRQAVEPGVHRHDHAQRRVDVLELLADEAEADVVHAGAAVLAAAPRCRAARAPPSAAGCSRSNRCSRSSSRICGATSRAPHSRTDCSSSRCSSVRSKSSMKPSSVLPKGFALGLPLHDLAQRSIAPRRCQRAAVRGVINSSSDFVCDWTVATALRGHCDGCAARHAERAAALAPLARELEMVGAAEERADARRRGSSA